MLLLIQVRAPGSYEHHGKRDGSGSGNYQTKKIQMMELHATGVQCSIVRSVANGGRQEENLGLWMVLICWIGG